MIFIIEIYNLKDTIEKWKEQAPRNKNILRYLKTV